MQAKKTDEHTMPQLLKAVMGLFDVANEVGVLHIIDTINRAAIMEKSSERKYIIEIIMKEVSSHFSIKQYDLIRSTKYKFDTPRIIAYNLLYSYADMSQVEISKFFNRSDRWINKKIKRFENLNLCVKADKELSDTYHLILAKICMQKNVKIEVNNE